MFQTDARLSVTSTQEGGQPHGVGPRGSPDAWHGPGLSPFVAKSASAQVEVGDGRAGLQKCGNVLAKTKHDLTTLQFEEMPVINMRIKINSRHVQNHFASRYPT